VKIYDVIAEDHLAARSMINELELDSNDCLAVRIMKNAGIKEIYTF